MPRMDGTGPMGTGPTGFGRGPCGKKAGGRFARSFHRTPIELSKEEKTKILKAEKEEIEKELKEIEKE
ncbi:MAG: DUF5320 domain-containing protein [archaeon]